MRRLLPRIIAVAVLSSCVIAGIADAASLTLRTSNPNGTDVAINVRFSNYPPDSVEYPNITGFDVARRRVSDCSAWVSLTATPVPRQPGTTNFTLTDTPEPSTAYEYRAVPVDINRNSVLMHRGYNYMSEWTIACSPQFSAPVLFGTVEDWGWTQFVVPCPGTCWHSAYVGGGLQDLSAYIGQTVMIFGWIGDGSVEGASVGMDHFAVSPCPAVVATRPTSWGRLKLLYR